MSAQHRCKDGTCKWICWNIRIDRTEGLFYSAGRDIIERRQTETARKTVKQLQSLIRV